MENKLKVNVIHNGQEFKIGDACPKEFLGLFKANGWLESSPAPQRASGPEIRHAQRKHSEVK